MIGVEAARRRFAHELRDRLGLRTPGLHDALASVPREFFLGPGPWLVFKVPEGYTSTPDADPVRVCQDVAVGLDPLRLVNNGMPSLVAGLIEGLDIGPGARVAHIGCATGYYSAILAEIVGSEGHVTAYEISPELAARATRNLGGWKQVRVVQGDAARLVLPEVDAILVSAGATHPRANWLDALRPEGRLMVPLTGVRAPGGASRFGRNLAGRVLRLRRGGQGFEASFLERIGLSPLLGGRDLAHERLLAEALGRSGGDEVRSMRLDSHDRGSACWLHAPDFCLSRRPPGTIGGA
ncbi:MAG TPA: methyltransferase domain-containing protein [Myxococcota bacterium]|nr:methyltransferase domain-containing protein [Myxococcota bacterium]